MKKVIFSFAMVMLVSTMSFGQMTNPEVYRIINQSKELNKNVTSNPDSIWPGQRLKFLFTDGYEREWVVQKGETETSIVKEISRLEISHGRVIAPKDTTAVDSAVVKPEPVLVSVAKDPFPWWMGILIVFLLGAIYYLFRIFFGKNTKEIKKQDYVDPTKAGQPFVVGGVKPENAVNHFRDLTLRNTEESNIVIRDVRPVFISTINGLKQSVAFADGTFEDLLFRNVPGHAGLVSRDKGKTFVEEYYFDGCGNPVYRNKSFRGDGLMISDTPIKFGDEEVVEEVKTSVSEEEKSSEVVEEKTVIEKSVVKDLVPDILVKEKNLNLLNVSVDHATMVERVIAANPNIHKVTMEFCNQEGSAKVTIETKNIFGVKKEEEK